MAMDFGKLDFSVSFNRLTAFPLDAKSYFESYASAEAAAQTAVAAGSSDSAYYFGQVVAVVENSEAKLYVIQPDKTLKEAGASVQFNENVFVSNDGVVDLYGFASAVAGAQLTKGADGKLQWVKPDTTTVEGLSTTVDGLSDIINGTDSEEGVHTPGLVEKVNGIAEQLEDIYTKEEVDAKLSSILTYKGSVATYGDLPEGAAIGDVYNVETADPDHNLAAGDNVAWNGESWDVLSGTVDLSGYLTKEAAAETYVTKEDGKTLISADLIDKLNLLPADAEKNVVNSVSSDFTISEDRELSLNDIAQSKVTGLTEALAAINEKLSDNNFSDDLAAKLNGIAEGAQVNVLESVHINNTPLEISDKAVNIPLAAAETVGVVKGSDAENGVAVSEDGTMSVNSVNVSKLTQGEDEWLILNGGAADVSKKAE